MKPIRYRGHFLQQRFNTDYGAKLINGSLPTVLFRYRFNWHPYKSKPIHYQIDDMMLHIRENITPAMVFWCL